MNDERNASESEISESRFGVSKQWTLTKMAYAMLAVFLCYGLYAKVGNSLLSRYLSRPKLSIWEHAAPLGQLVYFSTALFVLVEMLAVIWTYRPITQLFNNRLGVTSRTLSVTRAVTIGIVVGVAAFIICIPLIGGAGASQFIRNNFQPSGSFSLVSALAVLVFGAFLPVSAELVFRGVVQSTLASYVTPLAALLVSAVLFADIWPVFSFPAGIVLGIATGSLYRWKGNLLACVMANAVMTICGGAYLAWRMSP